MANIEAVIFSAKQKSYLAMRRWDEAPHNVNGVSRIDAASTSGEAKSGFAHEWAQFRTGFLGADDGHHVIEGTTPGEQRPDINFLEVKEDCGSTSTWVARGYRELGASDTHEPQITIVTDKTMAADLAEKSMGATASQDDIDAAAAQLAVGFSVSFLDTPGSTAPMGGALANFGDMESSDD